MTKNIPILIVLGPLLSLFTTVCCAFVILDPSSVQRSTHNLNALLDKSSSSSSFDNLSTTTSTTTTTANKSIYSSSKPNESLDSTDTTNPRKTGLALQLDDGTRKSHSFAQNTSFVTSFFKGLSNREAYANLITSLYFVYEAMEEAFDTTNEECVKLMDYDELRRVHSLKKDMEYFHGIDWDSPINTSTRAAISITPSYATQQYVKRVQTVAKENPKLLIAHQYTRYLGDLFGGQMMGGMASKSLNLEDGRGTAFYTFESIDNAQDFIAMWYRTLNSLDLTKEEKNAIVDEANLVFDLNIQILEEIEGDAFSAVMTLLWKSFRDRIDVFLGKR